MTSFVGELFVYPAIFFVWRGPGLRPTALFPERLRASRPGEPRG